MGAAEIARVAENKFVLETPLSAEGIVTLGDGDDFGIVGPIGDGCDTPRRNATGDKPCNHGLSYDDVHGGRFKRPVPQVTNAGGERAFQKWYAQFDRNFGIDVLQPVNQMGASTLGGAHCKDGNERRIGHGHEDVAWLKHDAY